jgi:predicted alpha/beta-fold hydrolase
MTMFSRTRQTDHRLPAGSREGASNPGIRPTLESAQLRVYASRSGRIFPLFRKCQRLTAKCAARTMLYNSRMYVLRTVPLALAMATLASAQQGISFPAKDGGRVCADLYGQGARAVVLAHGGRFKKESWRVQANALVSEGFRVLAIDFRGFGCSMGPGQADFDNAPFENDVLAAVHYLKAHGARTVSVVGGSFGGGAAGDASIKSPPGKL